MSAWYEAGLEIKCGDELEVEIRKLGLSGRSTQIVVLARGEIGSMELVMGDVEDAKRLRDELNTAITQVVAEQVTKRRRAV